MLVEMIVTPNGNDLGAGGREVVLSVRGLSGGFGEVPTLHNLDLDIYRGEVLGVVGASGTGKSVLARGLAGFVKPLPGAVVLRSDVARKALFGAWEGNWVAFNTAHDLKLPGSKEPAIPFLMYPQAENRSGFLDSLDPDAFRYRITARELTA